MSLPGSRITENNRYGRTLENSIRAAIWRPLRRDHYIELMTRLLFSGVREWTDAAVDEQFDSDLLSPGYVRSRKEGFVELIFHQSDCVSCAEKGNTEEQQETLDMNKVCRLLLLCLR